MEITLVISIKTISSSLVALGILILIFYAYIVSSFFELSCEGEIFKTGYIISILCFGIVIPLRLIETKFSITIQTPFIIIGIIFCIWSSLSSYIIMSKRVR